MGEVCHFLHTFISCVSNGHLALLAEMHDNDTVNIRLAIEHAERDEREPTQTEEFIAQWPS